MVGIIGRIRLNMKTFHILGGTPYHHRWELPGNYPVFTVVMVIYHYAEIIWRILVTPNFLYNIYDHEKYYPGELVNIQI